MIRKIGACLLAAAASASAVADDANVFRLGDIQVTAKSIKEEGAGVQTVDQQQIEDFNRETVSRALNLESGVTLANVGPRNESMVYVRGYDLRQVPVYVDGIPIYVPYDGYVDLARFNTFDLSQIEISKGFSSVLNGPNNFGGAINLISRRPSKLFEADAGAGTYLNDDFGENGYRAFANVGTNQGSWYMQAGLSYLDKNQYSLSNDFAPVTATANRAAQPAGERINSYNQDYKINLKLGYTPNATDEYAVNFIAQRGEKGVPSYAGAFPTASGATGPRYWQWPYWDKTSYYFLSNTAIGEVSYLKTRMYYDQFKNALNQYANSSYTTLLSGSSGPSYYDDYTYGASVEVGTRIVPSNELKMALHYKDDVHREHIINSKVQHFEDHIYSVALEDNQQFGERLNIVAGIGYDYSETVEAQNLAFATQVLSPFQTGDASGVNPEIGAFYKTTDTGVARVTFSQKTRFPTIKDRYSFRLGAAIPNPDLKPERVTHYEVGYADSWRNLAKFNASVFHDDIRDLIQLVDNVVSPGVGQNRNIGKARYRGFELGGSIDPTTNLEFGANYTYIQRENISAPTILLTDVPRHKVFAYGQWHFAQSWRFIGSAEYNSDRFSSTNGQRIASEFGIANAKVAWDMARNTSVEFGANNLFDRDYQYIEGYPEEGRNYFLNLLYKF